MEVFPMQIALAVPDIELRGTGIWMRSWSSVAKITGAGRRRRRSDRS